MPAESETPPILFNWAAYGAVLGVLFGIAYLLVIDLASGGNGSLAFVMGWFAGLLGAAAGLACGLVGGSVHHVIRGRLGAWLGGLAAAAVSPGFLCWQIAGRPHVEWNLGIGPGIPWILTPCLVLFALAGWMGIHGIPSKDIMPSVWGKRLYQSLPSLGVSLVLTVFLVRFFMDFAYSPFPPGN